MKKPTSDLRDNPTVLDFIDTAKQFCRLFDRKRRCSKRKSVERLLKATVSLYRAGFELPNVRPESGFSPLGKWFEKNKHMPLQERLKRDPRIQEHSRLHASIQKRIIISLGDEQCYRRVFDPFEPGAQAIHMALSDSLADIYCDVKKGLLKIGRRSEIIPPSVVWEWKFGMESHWGRHAVETIDAMHSLLFGGHRLP